MPPRDTSHPLLATGTFEIAEELGCFKAKGVILTSDSGFFHFNSLEPPVQAGKHADSRFRMGVGMIVWQQLPSSWSAQSLQYVCRASLELHFLCQVGKCFKSALPPCLFNVLHSSVQITEGRVIFWLGLFCFLPEPSMSRGPFKNIQSFG